MFEKLMQDVRYSVRKVLKNPVFALIVIVTLALGIGLNTAIFSVINAVLLRPLPFNEPGEIVQVENNFKPLNLEKLPVSIPEFADFQRQNQVFGDVGIFNNWEMNMGSAGGSDAQRLPGGLVSASLFDVLGVAPAAGRRLTAEDNKVGAGNVAIVSYDFWQRRFNGDPTLVGKKLMLDGVSFSVVGIMPKGFYFPDRETELWAPIPFKAGDFAETERGSRSYSLYARMKPGLTLNQARVAMNNFAAEQSARFPQSYPGNGLSFSVNSLQDQLVGDSRRPLLLLLIAVAMVLLIACANVANLLLARAAAWQREVDIRVALGSSRGRIVRQFLTESIMLSMIAGALGLFLAQLSKGAILATVAGNVARPEDVTLDWGVLAFTFGLCVLTGVIFGLAPALQVYKRRLYESLSESHSTAGRTRQRSRDLLIVVEVSLSLVLLICAGLTIKSLYRLQTVDTAFVPNNILSMKFYLPVGKYDEGQRAAFYTELLRRVRVHPGVRTAGVINQLPLGGGGSDRTFQIEGRQGESATPDVEIRHISADYFKTMGIPVVKGRSFTEQDDRNAPKVLMINQTMARKFFSGEDVVGRRMAYYSGPGEVPDWRMIVGVAGDVRQFGLNVDSRPEVYVPYLQHPRAFMSMVVHSGSDLNALMSAIRHDIQDLDRNQAVYDVKPLQSVVDGSIKTQRLSAMLLGSFAAFALFLAAIGIYGALSYLVSQRTRELGLRIALGAQPSDVLGLIMKKGLMLVFIGVSVGLVVALLLTRLLASAIYGVTATDPVTFIGIPVLLIAVSILACLMPARSALKVDPVVALRAE